MVRYGVSADEAHQFGLPCGGTLELLFEFDPQYEPLNELVQRLETGELVRRTVCCLDASVTLEHADEPEPLQFDGKRLTNVFGPEYRMLLIGAGMLTEYLATRSEEHTSELQSLMRISYAVFCLEKTNTKNKNTH